MPFKSLADLDAKLQELGVLEDVRREYSLAEARAILTDLLAWDQLVGPWGADVWDRAHEYMERVHKQEETDT
jgi:hypothetical protein